MRKNLRKSWVSSKRNGDGWEDLSTFKQNKLLHKYIKTYIDKIGRRHFYCSSCGSQSGKHFDYRVEKAQRCSAIKNQGPLSIDRVYRYAQSCTSTRVLRMKNKKNAFSKKLTIADLSDTESSECSQDSEYMDSFDSDTFSLHTEIFTTKPIEFDNTQKNIISVELFTHSTDSVFPFYFGGK